MATEQVRDALADRTEAQNGAGIHLSDALEYTEFGMVDDEA